MDLPNDYLERVYAGVLGKIIGVYLGRPFEGWTYDRIMAELQRVAGSQHDAYLTAKFTIAIAASPFKAVNY